MNRLNHSNVGVIEFDGKINLQVTCTAYVGHDKTPLLLSITDTQEKVKSIKAFLYAGYGMTLKRGNYPYQVKIVAKGGDYETLMAKKLPLTGQMHVLLANELMRGGKDNDNQIFIPIMNTNNPAPETFARLSKSFGIPFFKEWQPTLWAMARQLKLVRQVEHCYGMSAITTVIDEQWPTLVKNAQQANTIPSISEVYIRRGVE